MTLDWTKLIISDLEMPFTGVTKHFLTAAVKLGIQHLLGGSELMHGQCETNCWYNHFVLHWVQNDQMLKVQNDKGV